MVLMDECNNGLREGEFLSPHRQDSGSLYLHQVAKVDSRENVWIAGNNTKGSVDEFLTYRE